MRISRLNIFKKCTRSWDFEKKYNFFVLKICKYNKIIIIFFTKQQKILPFPNRKTSQKTDNNSTSRMFDVTNISARIELCII